MISSHAVLLLGAAAALLGDVAAAQAEKTTECTEIAICYCVAQAVKVEIAQNVAKIKGAIAAQRMQGKAIGYLSIPISSTGGGHEGTNAMVARRTTERILARFGQGAAWVLNTAHEDVKLKHSDARGAEYMLMWTMVIESGKDGLGRDFDFAYFAGPSDFAKSLGLEGVNDFGALEAYYDKHAPADESLRKIDRKDFRDYYGLRASATASRGAHDEWNIFRIINERRRTHPDFGMGKQIAMLFNGSGVAPGPTEAATSAGYVAKCP